MTTVAALADRFTASMDTDFMQPNMPIAMRWGTVVEKWPELDGRRLHDNLEDVYKLALGEPKERLFCAYDLACLQMGFYMWLGDRDENRRHIVGYRFEQAMLWRYRLADSFEELIDGKPAPERNLWIN